MSTRRLSWRHLGTLLVGMAAGVICLVMWSSSSASALDAPPAPTPAPPSLSAGVDQLLDQVTTPVDQLLQPLGVQLAPVVDPLTEQVVVPTVGAVETTAGELTQRLAPVATNPSLPVLPSLPNLPPPPDAGALAADLTAPSPATSTPVGDLTAQGAGRVAADGSRSFQRSGPAPVDGTDAATQTFIEPASVDGGSPSAPALPTPAPLVEAALGTLATTAGNASSGLVLLAVLVGLAAVAASPLSRRLALAGPLSPRALAYAIATPPG